MPLLRAKVNSAGTYSYIRLPQRFKGREVLILMEEDEKLFSQVIRDAYLLSSSLDYERRKIKEELDAFRDEANARLAYIERGLALLLDGKKLEPQKSSQNEVEQT